MEQATRNKLRSVVTQCRKLLEESIAQQLQGQFGIYAGKKDTVQIDDEDRLSLSSDEDQHYRHDLLDHLEHIKARSFNPKDALDQLIREVAFTHLNRLCAYKMMEARDVYVGGQKFRECVSRGINSNGFKFYLADHPDDERLFNTGQQELAYRHFLDWLGGLLSEEIGVLFNPNDPANRLYPRQKTLDELLALLNDEELSSIWEQDETIGWVYQYFTPKELREAARDPKQGGSQAPRNSYELAFRNQFFTPRYVVEFLTDNTLGRIWYEMRKGKTKLNDQCRYMVLRSNETFLDEGQEPPETTESQANLSQEELLKLSVHIPHRPKKDPRELKVLDPACGSGHFLLYCFDLLLTIYEEAYTDSDLGSALQQDYATLFDLRRDVPRLILAHNIHGIDIDLRATQIAALALWLRCHRAYQETGLKKDRPMITRSNFVCAEPMPGEDQMLKEFVDQLEPNLLGQLVKVVFDEMKLAGEAGSLLRIEVNIRDAVTAAKNQWLDGPVTVQRSLFNEEKPKTKQQRFDFSGISDDDFFEQAEAKVMEALARYAENAQTEKQLPRQLFADDAMRGFAFVHTCRQQFDTVLMNPPFGLSSKPAKLLIEKHYPRTKNDLYAAFVEQALSRLNRGGMLGAITSRTGFFLSSFQKWREEILLHEAQPTVFADLGYGVLDTAMVETAAYCVEARRGESHISFFRVRHSDDKETALRTAITALMDETHTDDVFQAYPSSFGQIPGSPFAYWVSPNVLRLFNELPPFESEERTIRAGLQTSDDFRFLRLWWEVPSNKLSPSSDGRANFVACSNAGARWFAFTKGGANAPFYSEIHLCVNWEHDGREMKEWVVANTNDPGTTVWSRNIRSTSYYFRPGITWPARPHRRGAFSHVPSGCIFSHTGPMIFTNRKQHWAILAILNSDAFVNLLHLLMARGSEGGQTLKYETGYVSAVPVPEIGENDTVSLTDSARKGFSYAILPHRHDEVSRWFCVPSLCVFRNETIQSAFSEWTNRLVLTSSQLNSELSAIDEIAFRLYRIPTKDQQRLRGASIPANVRIVDAEVDGVDEDFEPIVKLDECLQELLSFCCGATFGRWDVRYATGVKSIPDLPDPFDPLPISSPGMLNDIGSDPATGLPDCYPLRIDWDGILVDDADHQDDIVRRVRDVIEVIWRNRSEIIEKEARDILGAKSLRDYFRKPSNGGFWDGHVKRYSKSRRKAPIYWLLQSSKKNYALWLYYHRLDKDMLYKALLNYVEPRIQREDNRLAELRSQKSSGSESAKNTKKLDRDIEKQEDLSAELRDFEEKLRRVAELHLEPDLNDGVVLNIAPLHELVPWKVAKKYWNELLDGRYEWSSIGKQLREKGLVK